MIMMIMDGLLVLVVLWIVANVIRALLHKASNGGGFWGIYNIMTKEPKKVEQQVITEEVKNGTKKKGR